MPAKIVYKPKVLSDKVANTGGKCQMCGAPLEFWFLYELCDRHLPTIR